MALTIPRWLVCLTAGCALLYAGLIHADHLPFLPAPAASRIPNQLYTLRRAAEHLKADSEALADILNTGAIDDSIIRATGTPAAGLSIRASANTPAPIATAIESVVRSDWAQLGQTPGPAVVVVTRFNARMTTPSPAFGARGFASIASVLPSVRGQSYCLVVITLSGDILVDRGIQTGALRDRTLGPCGYVAAFGVPGPHVESWLADRTATAQRSTWTRRVDTRFATANQDRGSSWQDGALSSCAAGEVNACAPIVLSDTGAPSAARLIDGRQRGNASETVGLTNFTSEAVIGRRFPLGPAQESYLSDMVHLLGRERFGAFWRSQESVPVAFAQASGTTLEDWTRGWVQSVYGVVDPGPVLPVSDAIEGLCWAAIAIGGAMVIATRRHLG